MRTAYLKPQTTDNWLVKGKTALADNMRYSVYKDLCTYAKYDEYTYGQYVVEYGVHTKLYEGP